MAQVNTKLGSAQGPSLSEPLPLIRAPRVIASVVRSEGQMQLPATSLVLEGSRLLDALPMAEHLLLQPHLQRIALSQGQVLYHTEDQLAYVYFPTGALIAIVGATEEGGTLETGLVGAEGMAGLPVLMGVYTAPYTSVTRHAGSAFRMRADVFSRKANEAVKMRELLLRYANLSFNYASQAAVCNRLHALEQRTATWLLTTRDRLAQDDFHLTHDLIARSLGVRRPGVSVEIKKFDRAGWLHIRRAQIRIVDEKGLQTAACECYGVIKAELEQYLGFCANSIPPRKPCARRAL
jgi:CRP-like cAMP-binding protein